MSDKVKQIEFASWWNENNVFWGDVDHSVAKRIFALRQHQQSIIDELQPWKEAVIDHMMVTHCSIGESPKEKLDNILNWYIAIECDPQVSDSTAAKIIDAKDAEIEKRGEYIDSLHKKIRELHDIVLNTPVDIIRDVDGTFFTQQVIHKELSIGNVFRIVIGE